MGAFTQNECAVPVLQSMSDVHPVAMQEPDVAPAAMEQMLEGGLQSVSFVHPIEQVPVAVEHFASGSRSNTMQSGSDVQGCVLQRCVVESHALPAAHSRSLAQVR
jgi:hypothetical protein